MRATMATWVSAFLIIPAMAAVAAEKAQYTHALHVRFDIEKNRVMGRSSIAIPQGEAVRVDIAGLSVSSISTGGRAYTLDREAKTLVVSSGPGPDLLRIEYEATFPETSGEKARAGDVQENLVSPDGIVLTEGWYPSAGGLSVYEMTAVLPPGFEAASEAEEISVRENPDGSREVSFLFPHPAAGVHLIAGKYVVEKERYKDTDIVTYFFDHDKDLAATYREYARKYLDIYERMLTPFPFKRFAVVEHILPVGYSLPTFTALGGDIVRFPFIAETSLGHEILHQWFGNFTYIDYAGGNWAEGLTTYLADHHYEGMKGSAWEYRKNILISFQSYITPETDFALKDFSARTGRSTQSVGYGKTAMVFHMLKDLIGEEAFFVSLREFIERNSFREASWQDLQKVFQDTTGKDLDWFFRQWVDGKGCLEFSVADISVRYEGAKTIVSFEIRQKGRNDRFRLPVLLRTKDGETRRTLEIEKEITPVEVIADGTPADLVVDDNYDLFRRLAEDENPPVIERLMGDGGKIFVLPQGREGEYAAVAESLRGKGFVEKKETDLKYDDIKGSSLIIPGVETALVKRLFASIEKPDGDFFLDTRHNPYSREHVIAVIDGKRPADAAGYLRRSERYGKYSILVFRDGENVVKKTDASDRGMGFDLTSSVVGVEVPKAVSLQDIIDSVKDKDIVYVGEAHDRFEHHRVQLQVIRELHRRNGRIAIGMEMFQKPFQQIVDEYIAGAIDEKTFLKKSEYFKQWGFDYNLYREILLYAREYRIPVIALNIQKEIVSKVARIGLQSLSEEDLKEVPEQIDLSDADYRERLKVFFSRHATEGRNFDFFYQAQVLWDESMARNLNDFMARNPDCQVIVLAGGGHMAYGSGIPRRAYRMNSRDYAVILNTDDIGKNIADFVVFSEPLQVHESPKLMVQLREEGGKVTISGLAPGSVSERAGIREEDVVLYLDDTKIEGVDDMKIFLLFRKKGDRVTVRVLRKRLLLGDKEMEFNVTL